MKRRTFLQRIGSILAVLGVTEAQWLALSDRYSQALAQPSQRKLALLIGINQYQNSPALGGCLTDVELQKELLIHRFGFLASDILTLTEEKATRKSIEEAFLAHLGQQVKAGDVAVFHFSGYGTRIKSGRFIDTVQNALVPSHLQDSQKDEIVNYILEETLRLLLRSLPTDKVTAVLDTSYYAPSKIQPTGWRIRVRPESAEAQLTIEELEFLQQLRTQNSNPNHAVVLSATSDTQQLAREILFSGFSAGLFTYALTQYLWETTPATTIQFSLSHVGSYMHQLGSNQQPGLFSEQKDQPKALTVENLLLPNRTDGAEGVIRLIEDDGRTAQLFLAGLPPQVLENYGVNSRFTLFTGEQLTLRSRSGLTAKAQISKNKAESPLRGQLFQEAVRVLPRNINLIVGLDTGLERIERVDATSAFAAIDHISTVIAGEQPADCVFGKLSETSSRYGLFTPGGQLIPNTSGEPGEAVKLVVQRLVPKLPTLLAAKLWRLTENEGSSRLPVKATLEIINNLSPRIVMQRETTRTLSIEQLQNKSLLTPLSNATVPIGSRMQYRLQNQSDRQVYLMLLGLKNNRDAIAFYPWQSPEETTFLNSKPLFQQVVITPGETLLLPKSVTASEWMIPGPAYECEHQLILSSAPFKETLGYLEKSKYPITDQRPFGALLKPLEIVQALLQDLHNASAVKSEVSGISTDSYVLDVKNWASFNFDFQVA
ncbi:MULTISPECIES: caspase family protein [unclassified Nodularia (in: cyanobacteria)]|uniref:caspase family protein n=1 Tax=unclassified Nodularia (in: cyanobacteria) TaxID=2656917 RepID=UPI0018808E79|nr:MULTISPECIES: caspase family protein [unclassified Nodularia (in: cyanobacteria)]MBE9199389.1 caspase family protein [Nodularia sp. LEGE 06071]MCC2692886.1 caspase family protein [Nodularia sp. LEGE 04288]